VAPPGGDEPSWAFSVAVLTASAPVWVDPVPDAVLRRVARTRSGALGTHRRGPRGPIRGGLRSGQPDVSLPRDRASLLRGGDGARQVLVRRVRRSPAPKPYCGRDRGARQPFLRDAADGFLPHPGRFRALADRVRASGGRGGGSARRGRGITGRSRAPHGADRSCSGVRRRHTAVLGAGGGTPLAFRPSVRAVVGGRAGAISHNRRRAAPDHRPAEG
jgi:hypothetical protein